jgi:hypothetical protein
MGIEINSLLESFADVVDDCCFYRGLKGDSVNHPTALYHLNTGNQFGGDPALGAWASYGLGTVNQNLPSFLVLPDVAYPQGGAANWSNGFLPAYYQGTPLRPEGAPILDMAPPPGMTAPRQAANLGFWKELNGFHRARRPDHAELDARLESYELAFRMQAEMPGVVDLEKSPGHPRDVWHWRPRQRRRRPRPPLSARPPPRRKRRSLRAGHRHGLGLARLHRQGARLPPPRHR